jgi:hypothetical protein
MLKAIKKVQAERKEQRLHEAREKEEVERKLWGKLWEAEEAQKIEQARKPEEA